MEVIKVDKAGDLLDIIKCKQDEIVFIRYDQNNEDPEYTATIVKDIMSYCQDWGVDCLIMPKSDDDVYIELEQWEVDRLHKFDNKLQEIIKKKSPIILT